MNELEQMKNMFNCKICSKLLVDPVALLCGDTVCIFHLKDFISQKTFECECCKQEHSVQKEGFVINKFIQDQLKMQLNSIDINSIYEECRNKIISLQKCGLNR